MKREALKHPKMLDLAARLGVSRASAIGYVELMLDWCADVTPQGNIGRWSDASIAGACEWHDEPTIFVESLVSSGWIDRCSSHRLIVHDLAEHAPQWWKQKITKLGKEFLTAVPPTVTTVEATEVESVPPTVPSILLCSALETSALETSGSNPPTPLVEPAKPDPPTPRAKRASAKPVYDPNGALLPSALDVPEFRSSWARWILYRRNKRKPVSIEAAAEQLETFARYGPDVSAEAIRVAIQSDWQGVFPEKVQTNGNRSSRTAGYQPNPGLEYVAPAEPHGGG
jgi:hypothetical protein